MAKKKNKRSTGKAKHSMDVNRVNKTKSKGSRSANTVLRLKMYKTRPKRNSAGKILKHDFQSSELPSTRIQPDPRWFISSRVMDQKKMQFLREELQSHRSSNYNVILNERKLPMSLLNGNQKVTL